MKLTASQIRTLDELEADDGAAQRTLLVALNFHVNTVSRLRKEKREMWKELAEAHELDPDKDWTMKLVEGAMSIVEKEKEEES